ncbi:MAG: hypothetical protein J7521_01770 [Caulobacter sp.]|nr:hypothetical protein [Caulobacter sp.]
MGVFALFLLSPQGRLDRKGFWLVWLLLLAPWGLVFADPFTGFPALALVLYPVVCLFSKRMRDLGGRARWLAPLWVLLAGLILYAANSYLTANALASLSGWPGGRGLSDFGDMGGLYQVCSAILVFLVASLIIGTIPGDDGSKSRTEAAQAFE